MGDEVIWMEEFKEVCEEYKLKPKGKYFISNKGNFYSSFTKKTIKPQICKKGYLYVEIGRKKYKVHRLVAKYFIDNPNGYTQVNHKDCNKANNDVLNLEWCSNRQNYEYALKTGTFSKEFLYFTGNHKEIQRRINEKKLLK
jgi:hypothetical protein